MTENFNNPMLDADLNRLALEIDKLALDDLPRAGLEARVFAATMPVLQKAAADAAGAPRLVLAGTQATVRQRSFSTRLNTGMRLAAGFALLVTAGAVWLANKPAGVVENKPTIISQADDWALATTLFDDGSVRELEQVASDTAGLDDRIRSLNDGDLMPDEGSM